MYKALWWLCLSAITGLFGFNNLWILSIVDLLVMWKYPMLRK